MKLSKYIDHTLLKPEATVEEIKKLCEEAKKYDFMSVCINPSHIEYAKKILAGSSVLVCTVIGFPLGAMTTQAKVLETQDAILKGADEVDMVLNIGKLRSGDLNYVQNEISLIKKACGKKILKVIFENCLLTDEQIVNACKASVVAGADFVKTSTGFNKSGATIENVALMFKTVNGKAQVKAAGGVRSKEDFEKMLAAGATRIGTSNGVALIEGTQITKGY
jgi:deoxyribose-phosphate aldolase